MGLRDIERKLATKSAFQQKDGELLLVELDKMIEEFKNLEKTLKRFEKKHGKKLKENKEYYAKISELRKTIGLPEEIGVYDWKENPSLLDKITGKGYFDQLAYEILELSKGYIKETGGLISVAELTLKINKVRPGKIVPPDDVVKALKSLADDKLIQPLRELDSGVLIVEFVSIEMSDDQRHVFNIAARHGYLTMEKLIVKTSWSQERASRVLESLVNDGMALKDASFAEGTKYWFPSLGE